MPTTLAAPAISSSVPALALRAIASLGPREREIIALRFGGELSGPEIAEAMGLTLANVQQILSRSLRRMRVVMDEQTVVSEHESEGAEG